MTKPITIPEGFMKDPKGNYIKKETIKDIDIIRHELVEKLIADGRAVADQVAEFKAIAYSEIENFCELSANEYGVKRGGKKGNVSLTTYDGSYKIQLSRDESSAFDERLTIGQQLIRECLDELLEGSNPELKTIVDKAFETNKAGQVSVTSIMGLRGLKISHPKWAIAMEILADSIHTTGRKTYIRLYQRLGETDKYRQIALDGSSALPAEEVTS